MQGCKDKDKDTMAKRTHRAREQQHNQEHNQERDVSIQQKRTRTRRTAPRPHTTPSATIDALRLVAEVQPSVALDLRATCTALARDPDIHTTAMLQPFAFAHACAHAPLSRLNAWLVNPRISAHVKYGRDVLAISICCVLTITPRAQCVARLRLLLKHAPAAAVDVSHDPFQCWYSSLEEAVRFTRDLRIIDLLLKDGRADPLLGFDAAVRTGNFKCVRRILADARVSSNFNGAERVLALLESMKWLSSAHVQVAQVALDTGLVSLEVHHAALMHHICQGHANFTWMLMNNAASVASDNWVALVIASIFGESHANMHRAVCTHWNGIDAAPLHILALLVLKFASPAFMHFMFTRTRVWRFVATFAAELRKDLQEQPLPQNKRRKRLALRYVDKIANSAAGRERFTRSMLQE